MKEKNQLEKRKPNFKTGAMFHKKAGKLEGNTIILAIIGIVVLVKISGSIWGIFGSGLEDLTNDELCAKSGGYFNESATVDCATSDGSGIESSGYYANPFSDLFDPSEGLPFLLIGSAVFYMMYKKLAKISK
jgi:hypothetical protein